MDCNNESCLRLVPPHRDKQGTCCCACADRKYQHTAACDLGAWYRAAGIDEGHTQGRESGYDTGFADGRVYQEDV